MGKILIIKNSDFSNVALDKNVIIGIEIPQIEIDTDTKIVSLIASDELEMFYTIDGSTPTIKDNKYVNSFTVNNSATIKAISYNRNSISQIPKIISTIDIDENDNISLALSSSIYGSICYSTDGLNPTHISTQYSTKLPIAVGQIIKVGVYNNNILMSEIATIQIIA